MMSVFSAGNEQRSTGSTFMNADSSRSHAIVQLILTSNPIDQIMKGVREGKMQRSKLRDALDISKSLQVMFVDLAGNEPAGKHADPTRREEGNAINSALSALQSCIES